MCRTKSGIGHRNGDVTTSDFTESHTDIREALGLKDEGSVLESRQWVPIEFLPPEDLSTIEDLSTWRLTVDENAEKPLWWDEVQGQMRANMERVVERMFVHGKHGTMLGGRWIMLPGSRIAKLVGGQIAIVCKGANLDGASLSGANLSDANLSDANLSGADLSRANLSDANLSGANLDGASLSGANLSGANLSGANLDGASLSGADLSGANLYRANLYDANLDRANLYGANLLSTDPVPAGWVRDASNGWLVKAKEAGNG